MEYNEIHKIVTEHNGNKFSIVYSNGNRENKRLFISTCNNICEFERKSRTRGRIVSLYNVISISPIISKVTPLQKCRKNLNNIIKYLSVSGFWGDVLKGAKYLSSLTDNELNDLCTFEKYHEIMKVQSENGIYFFGFDCFINLFKRDIKTMRFEKYDRVHFENKIADCIKNKLDFRYRWRNGYDNMIQIKFDNDTARAWYSEEYKDCGNGHYYFLLDNKHVIFAEDD